LQDLDYKTTNTALAHASGWVIAQIETARNKPIPGGYETLIFRLLKSDPWALGYSVGAYSGALQVFCGIEDVSSEYSKTALGFIYGLELGVDGTSQLIGLDKFDEIQSSEEFIAAREIGGAELHLYLKSWTEYSNNEAKGPPPGPLPVRLFAHLAPEQLVPNFPFDDDRPRMDIEPMLNCHSLATLIGKDKIEHPQRKILQYLSDER